MSDHHSTGPRTPEGKAISSQNALKHGLTARDIVIKDDEHQDFAALQTDLANDLKPEGALEQLVFNRLLRAAWDLRRVERLENQLAASLASKCSDPFFSHDSVVDLQRNRLDRHHTRCERSFYRGIRELEALQTNRALRVRVDLRGCPELR